MNRTTMSRYEIEYNEYGYPEVRAEEAETVYDLTQSAGNTFGEKTFLLYEDREGAVCEISFRQTAKEARAVASFLDSQYGKLHVALLGRNSYEYASVLLGVTGNGSVAIPLDIKLPPAMLADTANRADMDLLFYDEELAAAAEYLKENCPNLKAAFCLQDLTALLRPYEDRSFQPCASPEDCALIIFTSGTTGKSKGVMLSHRNLVDYMRPYVYEFRDELPRTDIGKVDFTALEKEC